MMIIIYRDNFMPNFTTITRSNKIMVIEKIKSERIKFRNQEIKCLMI